MQPDSVPEFQVASKSISGYPIGSVCLLVEGLQTPDDFGNYWVQERDIPPLSLHPWCLLEAIQQRWAITAMVLDMRRWSQKGRGSGSHPIPLCVWFQHHSPYFRKAPKSHHPTCYNQISLLELLLLLNLVAPLQGKYDLSRWAGLRGVIVLCFWLV